MSESNKFSFHIRGKTVIMTPHTVRQIEYYANSSTYYVFCIRTFRHHDQF